MSKDDRSPLNPFTGKKHYDNVNDDKFLAECYNYYYQEVNQFQLLDDTPNGKVVFDVTSRLVQTVNDYLMKIGRYDYVDGYYDWEVHLVNSSIVNACCFPGGKIIVYAGILEYMENSDELAFVLAHEVSHALLDHSRTQQSVEQTKNSISNISWIGSFALDMMGLGGAGDLTRAAINVAHAGSNLLVTQPWGREHELEADKLGLYIAYLAGFNVNVAPSFWQRFTQSGGNDFDFFSTHPSDNKRIAVMRESLEEIYNEKDFYSKPLLPETPKAKKEYHNDTQKPIPQVANVNSQNVSNSNSQEITCPKCGGIIHSDDNFCNYCGIKLNKIKCPECNGEVLAEDHYCMYCGHKL